MNSILLRGLICLLKPLSLACMLSFSTTTVTASLLRAGNQTNSFSTEIVGGTNAEPGEFPFYVHSDARTTEALCGGSLIHPDIVLTAAHCTKAFPNGVSVYIGSNKLLPDPSVEKVPIDYGVSHYDYNDRTFNSDIMLIKLTRPSRASGVLMQLNSDMNAPNPGTNLLAIGFGRLSTQGQVSFTLQKAEITSLSHETCRKSSRKANRETMLCATATGRGICFGDSGGPLFMGSIQYGIASFVVQECNTARHPDFFARVSHFFEWTQDFICRHSAVPPSTCICGGSGGEICQRRNNGCAKYVCVNDSCQPIPVQKNSCACGKGRWDGTKCVCWRSLGPFRKSWCRDEDGFCTVPQPRRILSFGTRCE